MQNESCPTTRVGPKTVLKPYPNPKDSPLRPQEVKNDPKIKSKSNAKIERKKQDESFSTA